LFANGVYPKVFAMVAVQWWYSQAAMDVAWVCALRGTSVAAVEAVEAVPYFERPLAHLEADCFVVALVVPVMDGGVVGSKSVSRWCGLRGIYKS
jgi:hypothetical protein